ncbi:hypothetical protein [Flammeovirga kamogawensis]|uniref:Outer membrane beta-barrel protein n=1 Tax=Flammeovirga kamogawensis TaxID=373891 RepID=A0ABX8GXM1_9BACT|nr:hypothetical protein [Flammeovirga kamogawensis]MBB6460949.1 hypothetical protein [Flammeovirga kamogawensis]QWG08291.1 hypothetical protein KM029_04970 [Flammeovirga kamogawensis]TRX66590.1 hypothetical protein EO216_00040 [Flammeovirga kamogawensis]
MKNIIMFLFFTTILAPPIFGQGKIDQVKRNTKKKKITYYYGPSSSSSNYKSTSHSSNNSSLGASIISGIFIGLASLIPSERGLAEKHGAPMGLQYYPYMEKGNGKYTRNETKDTPNTIVTDAGIYYESQQLFGLDAMAQFNLSRKISFSANTLLMREKFEDKKADIMGTLNLNAAYHLFTYTGLDMWLGGGFSHLFLENGFSGANFNIGTEIFIAKPVSLYTNWYFAGLSDNVNYTQGLIGARTYIKNTFIKVGYQFSTITGVTFKGLNVGLGIVI